METLTILVVDVSGTSVGAVAHLNRGVFPFSILWSLYMATFGQAILSAFGPYRTAGTFGTLYKRKTIVLYD